MRLDLAWLCNLAFVAFLLGSLPCEGETVVLTDDFSTGIHGWTYAEEPGAVMTWDPIEGNPKPGSVVLSSVEVPTDVEGYLVLGPCMHSFPREWWRIESTVKKTGHTFGLCEGYVSYFTSPDCTGEGTATGSAGGTPPMAPDVWHFRVWEVDAFSTTRSARPVLLMSVRPGAAITCHFDSIVVSRSRGAAATDVPLLSAAGLVITASVLAALAVALLARRRIG